MKKSSYWQDRFIKEEQRRNKDARAYIKTIEKQYDIALSNIEKDINNWYMRIAKNNQVSLLEARKLLSKKELAEFKWGINEYIKAGEANSSSPTWIKELENASARVHISRLEALKLQIQNQIEILYGTRDKQMQDYLIGTYGDTYYHAAYEIQKGIGLGSSVYSLDTNKVNQIIRKPWAVDSKNFSERIWEDKNKLINTLHNGLTQSFIRGSSPYQIVSDIAKEFNVRKSVAGRLVMTELAAYAAKAQENCYKDLGVDQYEIVATLDSHTSPICQEMDGKVFSLKEYEIGVTANPFHPNCRTVTAPYFADDTKSMRAMRKPGKKTNYIYSDIKYKEWYSKYVVERPVNIQLFGENEVKGSFKENTITILEKEFGKLNTDQVILRDERIEHIKEGHPEVVEIIKKYAKDIIESPDYILKDAIREETILCVKKLEENSNINVVIKLALENSKDKKRNKNSIITSFLMNDKRLKRELKKKECIYKNIKE
ncbi:minor capsid protein [uncultured Fusobacterium sp.]|uniref:minor capsid protein n=1 Tax=uncultured Fusobacterium sp. TaxID=159267 RepID=UPI0025EFBBE5|nr:minor capsid protein [uncultured Fusobacterium sp.]